MIDEIDEGLEALIDKVGRQRVFDRAKALGWANEAPPKWVWRGICAELLLADAAWKVAERCNA